MFAHQMDFETAYVEGDLRDDLHMQLLEIFTVPRQEDKLSQFEKPFYWLEEAAKDSYHELDSFL